MKTKREAESHQRLQSLHNSTVLALRDKRTKRHVKYLT